MNQALSQHNSNPFLSSANAACEFYKSLKKTPYYPIPESSNRTFAESDSELKSGEKCDVVLIFDETINTLGRILMNTGGVLKHSSKLKSIFEKIKYLRADPSFYVALVGEFSSGKSSFINGLLGDYLLKTSVLATTANETRIFFGSEMKVEVEFKDGTEELFIPRQDNLSERCLGAIFPSLYRMGIEIPRTQEYLNNVSDGEEQEQKILRITVYSPSADINDDLVLIDTPGSNVDNEHHFKETIRVLNHECDAAIITIPSDIPLSQTLVSFLNSSLRRSVEHCIFMVTKMDLIKDREKQEEFIENIKLRIQRELQLDSPSVFPVSTEVALNEKLGINEQGRRKKLSEEDKKKFNEQFYRIKKTINTYFLSKKGHIRAERIKFIIKDMFAILEGDLRDASKLVSGRINELKHQISIDPENELAEICQKQAAKLNQFSTEMRKDIKSQINKWEKKYLQNMSRVIEDKLGDKKFIYLLTLKRNSQLVSFKNDIIASIEESFKKIISNFHSNYNSVHKEFTKRFPLNQNKEFSYEQFIEKKLKNGTINLVSQRVTQLTNQEIEKIGVFDTFFKKNRKKKYYLNLKYDIVVLLRKINMLIDYFINREIQEAKTNLSIVFHTLESEFFNEFRLMNEKLKKDLQNQKNLLDEVNDSIKVTKNFLECN